MRNLTKQKSNGGSKAGAPKRLVDLGAPKRLVDLGTPKTCMALFMHMLIQIPFSLILRFFFFHTLTYCRKYKIDVPLRGYRTLPKGFLNPPLESVAVKSVQ